MSQDFYEGYIHGKPLNPNRGLPSMTYAQAQACGLTSSSRLWDCTDDDTTPIPIIDNLNSDSATSALSAKQGKVLNDKFNVANAMTNVDISAYTVASGNTYECPTDGYLMVGGSNTMTASARIYDRNLSNFAWFQTNLVSIVYVKKGSKLCGENFTTLRFVKFD